MNGEMRCPCCGLTGKPEEIHFPGMAECTRRQRDQWEMAAACEKARADTAEEEVEDLKKELAQWLDEAMRSLGFYEKDGPRKGWWETTALRTVRDIGDRLVELGTWERHPDGHGRRWWYRPVEKGPKA